MTTLRPGLSASLLTRDRLLVGFQILISGVVMVGLGIFSLGPSLLRIDTLQTELVDLQAKKDELPSLRNELRNVQKDQQVLLDQQVMLVDLVAGQDRISTFLRSWSIKRWSLASRLSATTRKCHRQRRQSDVPHNQRPSQRNLRPTR